MKDKGLFFLILSFVCFWLVLDQVFGNKLIEQFVSNILPSSSSSSLSEILLERAEQESTYNTAPTDKNNDGSSDTDDMRRDENGDYTDTTAGNQAGYKG